MHALRELLFDFPQLRPHALADRPALYGEVPVPVFPADVRETQKVERLRLAFSFSFPVLFGGSSELDPARFVWMEFQTKLPQPDSPARSPLLRLARTHESVSATTQR